MARSLEAAGAVALSASAVPGQGVEDSAERGKEDRKTMAQKSWTLTDVANHEYVESIRLSPETVQGMPGDWSVGKQVLRGGHSDGVDLIEIRNGQFRFAVVPTRGMGIWEAWHGEFRLGWKSPVVGPVNPRSVRLCDPSGLGWLDGFNELLVRCGLESNGGPEFNANGTVRYALHGKIANTPAHRVTVAVDGAVGTISVMGVVDESRLFGNKLRLTSTIGTRLGRSEITIADTVTNLSGEPSELELIYHTNFGLPLLGPGARLVAPAVRVAAYDQGALRDIARWNQYDPETPGAAEACYFIELAAAADETTQVVLRNAGGDRGIRYRFDRKQLPCFTLWKNCQAAADGYVTGLEPGTNLPNTKSFEKRKGRVIVLAPGQSREFRLTLEVLSSREAVAAAEKAVAGLQQGKPTTICPQLVPEWSEVS